MKRMFRGALSMGLCMSMLAGITTIPVHATDYNTPVPRIPNDPIDINTLCVETVYTNSFGSNWAIENNTLTYDGKEIPIYTQVYEPTSSNSGALAKKDDYTVEIQGNNIRKELVKEGYTDYMNVYGNILYNLQDEQDHTTYDFSTLMSFYKLARRLNIKPTDQNIIAKFKIIIPYLFTVEELRQYSCAREFAEKTADTWETDPYLCETYGFISEFEDTITPAAQRAGYSSVEAYMDHIVRDGGDGVSYWEVNPVTVYPLYFVVPLPAITQSQADRFAETHNFTIFKNSDNWYFRYAVWTGNSVTAPYYAKQLVPEYAEELGIDKSLMTVRFEPDVQNNYSTYYAFSERDALNAWAEEMDTWSGHWDFYLYGDTHFEYRVGHPSTTPGYYAINWGGGSSSIMDRLEVQHDPEYKYYITGPGDFTVTVTGKNNQDGRGRANIVGTHTSVIHVEANEKEDVLTGPANSWQYIDGNWYHYSSTGQMETGWITDQNWKYYLDENGKMVTGDVTIDGKSYTFDRDGHLLYENTVTTVGWKNEGGVWYYYDTNGQKQTGWVTDAGKKYYLNKSGVMTKGWEYIDDTWYYFTSSGEMQTGWVPSESKWYYMNADGSMATGWVYDGSAWYYMSGSGVMVTGWLKQGNKWYYLKSSGAMATGWVLSGGTWYYMYGDGAMATGWVKDGGVWYYLYGSGAMARNTWVGNYYLTSSGAMAVNTWIGSWYVGSDGAWVPDKTR